MRPARVAMLLGLIAVVATGCGEGSAGTRAATGSIGDRAAVGDPFPGSAEHLDELAKEAVRALIAEDWAAVGAFRLTEYEHNDVVFPELPASDPSLGISAEYVWQNIESRDRSAINRAGHWFSGREVTVSGSECAGEPQVFETFVVHTDCWVHFEDSDLGPARVQLYKDVVERGGGFKIFRYYDNLPEPGE